MCADQFCSSTPRRRFRRVALPAVLAFAASGSALAASGWTSVGSTGTVDETCVTSIQQSSYEARFAPGTTPARCTIRYQVFDTWDGPPARSVTLGARFIDNGFLARVIIRLHALDLASGAAREVGRLDSNDFGDVGGYQIQRTGPDCLALDFSRNSYWIEVSLSRYTPPTTPLQGVAATGLLFVEDCLI